jgi:hypothetical protein
VDGDADGKNEEVGVKVKGRMQTRASILTTLLATLAATASAQGPLAPCAAYWDAAAVFVGRIESVRREATGRTASMAVVESFRGVSTSRVEASVVVSRKDYCLPLTPGSEYVFYVTRDANGAGVVDACGRSRRLEDGAADVDYARSVKSGTAPAGVVTGHVAVARRTLAGKPAGVSGAAAPVVTINLLKAGVVVDTTRTSTGSGSFSLDAPDGGAYRIGVEVPDGFYADEPFRDVTLPDPRACADVTVSLFGDGWVSGRVVDAKGRTVAGLTIELASGVESRRTVTDRNGRYALTRIPSGRFTLSVPAGLGASAARLFYPGVDAASGAGRIALAAGERKVLDDFTIPATRAYVAVSGVVLDAGGSPAEGARVYLKGLGEDDRIVAEPVVADFMGRFVIAARAGVEYGVFAERARGASGVDATDTRRVTAAEGLAPLRLVLERRY